MATAELIDHETVLKDRLFARIESTRRLGVLRGMLSILDDCAEEDVYELTPEEEEELDERIRDCKAGIGIPHEIVAAEVREWLQARK